MKQSKQSTPELEATKKELKEEVKAKTDRLEALEKANNSNQNEVSSVRKQLTEAESQLGKVRSEMEQMKVQHRDSTSVS